MNEHDAARILSLLSEWAARSADIQALILVGSWARGEANPASDLDLIALAADPERLRATGAWLADLGFATAGFRLVRWSDEQYGVLWCRRIILNPGAIEVELGFAHHAWAATTPIDPGTRRVISDGVRVLYDGGGMIRLLLDAAEIEPKTAP